MKQQQIAGFYVSGACVRTSNAAETGPDGRIPGLWGSFFASQPDLSQRMYGVYSHYESDLHGEFNVTAGVKAGTDTQPGVHIQSGSYLAFPAQGVMPDAIIQTWKTIWEHFAHQHEYERAYGTDFEEYLGPESGMIYIGIKPRSL